jgi:hypothetical protein
MKMPKNARQTVRYNAEIYEKLKEKGWTIQKLLDWAIEQNSKVSLNVSIKKAKSLNPKTDSPSS